MRLRLSLLVLAFSTLFTTGRAEPLKVGDDAPKLTVLTDEGVRLDLADVYQKGFTLVYFYPKAFTGGCTAQGCSLRDSYEVLAKRGVTVIGSSTDDVQTQRSFREKHNFPFTLVADVDKKLMRAFGQNGIFTSSRQAFLVDKAGKVVWRDLEGHTKDQADQVLAALDKVAGK